ncbi:MAG: galactonate dehydratase [Halanaerobiales bacterium]|nr:galactonate dehydratase [Halanaerobiales bacterium]HKL42140.1 galactonate dehydratase [Clostridia bacterium]
MKICDLKLFKVPPRWLFLKIITDEGISGWGEPIVEGRADTVRAAVEELSEYIVGENPLQIEDLWQKMYRGGFYRGGPILMSAISGIDQALWDIKGKFYQTPVYELLGGKTRNKIEVYSWIGGDRPNDVANYAKNRKNLGFKAVKMNATDEIRYIDNFSKLDSVIKRVAAVRSEVGNDFKIAIDFHGRLHKAMARVLAKKLEPYDLMFIEEPVLSENYEAIKDLRNCAIPIALGERLFSRWDYKHIMCEGLVDIIQPDLSHAGGISETKKIATMAESFDIAVAPHAPLGPINLAAALQLDACTPNAFIQEQSLNMHYNETNDLLDYIKNKEVFNYKDGFVDIPEGPGLGIEIDEEKVTAMSDENINWKNPIWRNEDGTITEW